MARIFSVYLFFHHHRYPIKVNLDNTESMTICEGDTYKLEVGDQAYQLYWLLKGSYYLMYRFERNTDTGMPRIVNKKETLKMCQELYDAPGVIPIRDIYVKISLQTSNSRLDFRYSAGLYSLKVFTRGQVTEERELGSTEFFNLVRERCGLQFDVGEFLKMNK